MIQLQVIGNLGGDATLTETKEGKVLNFSVCHTEKLPGGGEVSQWVKCAMWGGNEKLAPYLLKGTKVFCQGAAKFECWVKDGAVTGTLAMTVFRLELCSAKKD